MKTKILTLAITVAFSTLSFGQIKVTPGGDFAIGQNYSTNNWFKTEINGERKVALGLSTRHEAPYEWACISDATNPLTKHWIVSANGYSTSHNFWVYTWGEASAITYRTWNDSIFKKNIRPISNASLIISGLNPKYYDYKVGFNGTTFYDENLFTNQPGLIAQDVQLIIPQLVNNLDSTGKLGVNYQGFIPILIQYAKEQALRIDNLEAALLLCCSSSESRSNTKNDQENILKQGAVVPPTNNLDKESSDKVVIVPNPNNGSFEIISEMKIDKILVTDLNGKFIDDVKSGFVDSKIQVTFDSNRSGVYYVHTLHDGVINSSQKVVILN
jgi:hypothetical protein